MIELTETHLPEEFVHLLHEQNTSQSDTGSKVVKSISNYTSLEMLALRSMKEFQQKDGNLQEIIQTLGWNNFRDRLSSVYIKKNIDGHYPFETDLEVVSDVKWLEESLMKYSVSGTPRSFLMAFYLKLQAIEHATTGVQIKELKYYDKILESIELLKLVKLKVLKIDWLLLQLMHFCDCLPYTTVEKSLKDGLYDDLYNQLSSDQKSAYINNLLSYGFAINDQDSLIPPAQAI